MRKKMSGAQADKQKSNAAAGKYDDIIDLPRPKMKHARMSMEARAAQFAPFAALVGYESMVQETSEQVIEAVEHETEVELEAGFDVETTEFAADIEYESAEYDVNDETDFPDGVDEVYPD